jgi:hypothetical protein
MILSRRHMHCTSSTEDRGTHDTFSMHVCLLMHRHELENGTRRQEDEEDEVEAFSAHFLLTCRSRTSHWVLSWHDYGGQEG